MNTSILATAFLVSGLAFAYPSNGLAQTATDAAEATAARTLQAVPLAGEITIDGRLDDPAWAAAEVATDFVQQRPEPGDAASERTEVRVLYDDRNLYVGMRMYDDDPAGIAAQLGRRDAVGLYSDWAHVVIDSYYDRRTAYRFSVTPAGVKRDVLQFDDTREDGGWDAVWDVAMRTDDEGWTAEFRIPFSQLRFSTSGNGELTWGINFIRDIARKDERAFWSPHPPDAGRFVSLFGTLHGLRDILSPRRVEATPYMLARADRVPGDAADPFRATGEPGVDAGLDLMYGLGPNLTLSATVNPDFGQVEVDPAVVNLSAFETFFPERRPFFLEGADIFRFGLNIGDGGNESLFYTRRIGRSPQAGVPGDAVYADVPGSSRILGAGKLSGRSGSWSLGALNALTSAQSARYVDGAGEMHSVPVEPLTNYGVLRASRNFRDGQSAVGGMLTSVHRDLSEDRLGFLAGEAYSGGIDARHRFAGGDWQARGWLSGSHVRGDAAAVERLQRAPGRYYQRPDADHLTLDPERTSMSGAAANLTVEKVSGRWRGGGIAHTATPGFEVNDLGFQQEKDLNVGVLYIGRVSFEPGRIFRNWNLFSNLVGGWTGGGERAHTGLNLNGNLELRSAWGGYGGVEHQPSALTTTATRGGPALHRPARTNFWSGMYTDRRRPVNLDLNVNGHREHESGAGRLNLNPNLTVRPAPRLQLSAGPSWTRNVDRWQYVGTRQADGAPHYLFGHLEQTTLSMNTRLNVTFTPDLTLELFAQPFLSAGAYSDFRRVNDPRAREFDGRFHTFAEGTERREVGESGGRAIHGIFPGGAGTEPAYTFADPGFNVRSLRGNAVLRWEYRPGSTLFLVWQQQRSGSAADGDFRFGRDTSALFREPAQNVLLLKATYWFGL